MLDGKSVLITGGTGSFGSVVLERLLAHGCREIRILSRDEKKQDEMRNKLQNDLVKFYIGDVRDKYSINDPMFGVDLVFHAAALKQVPSCEFYPMQAVLTNIIGAENVINAAIENCVNKCIVLSTDKAVQPVNAMGMSKALMEKIMISKSATAAKRGVTLCATRYGNVMASRGSVIPLFLKQINDGMPITITDPKMTRFLMTVEESVDLVLYAFENAEPGDIFVQKSPASTIGDLAIALTDLVQPKHPTRIIGTRHGEKPYETLVSREELSRSEDLGAFFRIRSDTRDLNYNAYFSNGLPELSELGDYSSQNTQMLNIEQIKELLMKLPVIQNQMKA